MNSIKRDIMKKRGKSIFKALFVIVISAIIALFFPYIGKSYGTGKAYFKLAAAKDLSLLIDTLYAYPGDAYVVYSIDLKGYTIKFYSDKIIVFDSEIGEIDPTAGIYKFVKTDEKIIETEIKEPKTLVFDKSNNEIKINKLR